MWFSNDFCCVYQSLSFKYTHTSTITYEQHVLSYLLYLNVLFNSCQHSHTVPVFKVILTITTPFSLLFTDCVNFFGHFMPKCHKTHVLSMSFVCVSFTVGYLLKLWLEQQLGCKQCILNQCEKDCDHESILNYTCHNYCHCQQYCYLLFVSRCECV